jgi:hypothetical protein
MTTVSQTYTSLAGETLELLDFLPTRLYSPSEQRAVKANNEQYWATKNADIKLKAAREAAAKIPKPLSEDDLFALAQARDEERKKAQRDIEARQQAKEQQARDYLAITPEVATIFETSPFAFLLAYETRIKQGYELLINSLSFNPNGIYTCDMNLPAKPAKTGK